VLLSFVFASDAFGQQPIYRRYFIIAYDISTPFKSAEKQCPAYEEALINLFSNQSVFGFNEAYQDNLIIEKNNGVPFFEKNRDQIAFFHFNIAASEFDQLRTSVNYGENEVVSEYLNLFLKNKEMNYSDNRLPIKDYWHKVLAIQPTPVNFGSGVSMSNFVYPLVLDKLDTDQYAEEYVLIILSDFLTGSMLGNTKDLDRVKDIYRVSYDRPTLDDSPVSFIKKKIDYIASQYFRIDFFQYSFISKANSQLMGILAYKIKPKVGVKTPEDVSLFVDGDLDLYQRGYKSEKFKTNKTKIKFTHNKNLEATELKMTIASNNKVFFDDAVASKNEAGNWVSAYTNDNNLMKLDTVNHSYYLPVFKISLDSSIINDKDPNNLNVTYQFKTSYKVTGAQPMNFIYKTERALSGENIHYSTKAIIFIMYYLLPILAVLLIIVWFAAYGKPKRLEFQINGYLDSFEKTDYQNNGKTVTPYKSWIREEQIYGVEKGVDLIPISGQMFFKSPNYPFNWKSPVKLQLSTEKCPAGFELFLKHKENDSNEFGPCLPLIIDRNENGNLSFFVGIRQVDATKQIDVPELVKFSVEATVNDSFLGIIKSEISKTINYIFHIGIDLQDVWVGFDPGTTGSCVAIGSSSSNIILGRDTQNNTIMPSVITVDKTQDLKDDGSFLWRYGQSAIKFFDPRKTEIYRSIKKMLGFKDSQEIIFNNGVKRIWTGKEIAAALVKDLYQDVTNYINQPNFKADEYKRGKNGEEKFNPYRAVVAIPNNFTASKIQDMLYCITRLNQFKEIRYIYETEAVLFYYLSNYSKFNKNSTFDSETILVFDMGGATINATVIRADKTVVNKGIKYNIDFLGKIGYGIGGDTIDYCIIKLLLSCCDEFVELKDFNLVKDKEKLADLAFQIKKEIVHNYYTKNEYLITATSLELYINKALGISISIDAEKSKMYAYFKENTKRETKLLKHPLFTKLIYNNIKDCINEVIALSGNVTIDKIIFSGRSTAFPLVKETVKHQLNNITAVEFSLDESKTAVAHGACWYGINNNAIRLNNLKTSASFGFIKTMSADRKDIKYHELVEQGHNFNTGIGGIRAIEGNEYLTDDFAFDGNKVNFYQIMGKDTNKIISEQEKHKFSKIAFIIVDQLTRQIAMQVNENDVVNCLIKLQSSRELSENSIVADQEIGEANEEHYTWIVK